jgi:hypothetical protein
MAATRLLLTTGEWVAVEGAADEIARQLEDASRSTSGTLAWLKDVEGGQAIGIIPAHVVMLRAAGD